MYNAFKRRVAKIWLAFKGRGWRDLRIRIDFKGAVKFQIIDMGTRGKGRNVISLQKGHKEVTMPHDGRAYLDHPNQNLPIKGKDY